MTELRLTIPLEPPSANHYKKPRHFAGCLSFYHTPLAKDWFRAVALLARGEFIEGEVSVEYRVYRGKGSKGDVDNYAKCRLDGLVRAGVLQSDNSVVDIHGYKFRDRENPRTEILIRKVGIA